jgi:type II secretory pathway pseudopilin PulG
MNSSEFRVQSSEWKDQDLPLKASVGSLRFYKPRTPNSLLRTSRGFSYVALLVAIVIIGISLGAAGKYWQNVMLREKEEEMLFRGDQYRKAIERYYNAVPGRPQYPQNIDDLLTDNRTPVGKRHLRQKYKDPMTGEDFAEIRDPRTRAIVGVYSTSEKEPLKKDNFPPAYKDLAGKSKYSEWLFIARAKPGQAPLVLQLTSPGETPGTGQQQNTGQSSGFVQPVDTSQQPIIGQPQIPGQTQGFGQAQGTGPTQGSPVQPQFPGQPVVIQPQFPGQPEVQPQPLMRPRLPRGHSHGG